MARCAIKGTLPSHQGTLLATSSMPAFKGIPHSHMDLVQAVVRVFFSVVQVVVIRLHEPGQERVGQIPDDEEWDSIGIPLGSPGEGGVLEDPGIANSASQDEG